MPFREPIVRRLVPVLIGVVVIGAWWTMDAAGARPTAPVSEFPSSVAGSRLALILTGDAGPTAPVRDLARVLARAGLPSLAVAPEADRASPARAGVAIDQLLRDHLARWDRQHVLVIGYARGAGMAPFVANRIGRDLRSRIDGLVLVGLAPRVSFRRRWGDRWRRGPRPTDLPVLPELERLRGIPVLCLYKEGEDGDAFCSSLEPGLVHREVRPILEDGETEGTAVARRVLDFVR